MSGMKSTLLLLCALLVYLAVSRSKATPSNGDLRFAGYGSTVLWGRVEIYLNNQWGTICDSGFGIREAEVACKQMGLGYSVNYRPSPYQRHGLANSVVHLSLSCDGTETHILNCRQFTVLNTTCSHLEDIEIICSDWKPWPYSGEIRLVGGVTASEGHVEIYLNGEWGRVCSDNSMTGDEANVICSQLGYDSAVSYTPKDDDDPGSGGYSALNISGPVVTGNTIWYDGVLNCVGNELCLTSCLSLIPASPVDKCSNEVGVRCTHSAFQNIKVGNKSICEVNSTIREKSLRLVGGAVPYIGRLEVYHNNQWGVICRDRFYAAEGHVACRQLGYSVIFNYVDIQLGDSPMVHFSQVDCRGAEDSFADCNYIPSTNGQCGRRGYAAIRCYNRPYPPLASVRMLGGSGPYGVIEVFNGGRWGPICDEHFDIADANVVCRQFGYAGALRVIPNSYLGVARNFLLMTNIHCVGNETHLWNCPFTNATEPNCDFYNQVAVHCGSNSSMLYGELRLTGGSSSSTGRLEINIDGVWGSVCSRNFAEIDGHVACRQLGFSGVINVTNVNNTQMGNHTVLLNEVHCKGYEDKLMDCRHRYGDNVCNRTEDVLLTCDASPPESEGRLRLVGGIGPNSGRLEIFKSGTWGTVCSRHFDQNAANVACRQMGFSHAIEIIEDFGGGGDLPTHIHDPKCNGSENSLINCTNEVYTYFYCDDDENVGIICYASNPSNGDVRLAGYGATPLWGRLEIFLNDTWGTICDDTFRLKEADVACRQMGLGYAINYRRNPLQRHGMANSTVHFSLSCDGNETHILNCQQAPILNSTCTHDNDIEIICSQWKQQPYSGEIRLAGGTSISEGHVEIYLNGEWGRVCSDRMSSNEANVICRQLGYDSAVSYTPSDNVSSNAKLDVTLYGVTNKIWINTSFNCTGDEVCLTQCLTSIPTSLMDSCSIDVGVRCTHDAFQYVNVGSKSVCEVNSRIADKSLRLVDFDGDHSGILEVYHNNEWDAFCFDNFYAEEGHVACRDLGYSGISRWLRASLNESSTLHFYEVDCRGTENSFQECEFVEQKNQTCRSRRFVAIQCTDISYPPMASLRMLGGSGPFGVLEVFNGGDWGPICDVYFDQEEGDVACRQLGYTGALKVIPNSYLGVARNFMLVTNIQCNGDEDNLWDCTFNNSAHFSCDYYNQIAVHCGSNSSMTYGALRLTGGNSSFGRLEINLGDSWGSVCVDGFDKLDGHVACRQLGFKGVRGIFTNSSWGNGANHSVFLTAVFCKGYEDQLIHCRHDFGENVCTHNQDVMLSCDSGVPELDGQLQLIDKISPSSGRLEILLNGLWGTVCSYHFNLRDAMVACRQLGYSRVAEIIRNNGGGSENPINIHEINCVGNESRLIDCDSHVYTHFYCHHSENVAIACDVPTLPINASASGDIRLAGDGSTTMVGRLEMYWNRQWGTVCGRNFGMAEAHVACRQLGLGYAANYSFNQRYGWSNGSVKLEVKSCNGDESHLFNCDHRLNPPSCSHLHDVNLVCTKWPSTLRVGKVRLTGGRISSEGFIEVYAGNESWYKMCGGLRLDEGDAICRQLGYTGIAASHYGPTEGDNDMLVVNSSCQINATEAFCLDFNGSCFYTAKSTSAECEPIGQAVYIKCDHDRRGIAEDISQCSQIRDYDNDLRLFNISDSSGLLQIYYNGSWANLCGDQFNKTEGEIACRQLGFSSMKEIRRMEWTYLNLLEPDTYNISGCTGFENKLSECLWTQSDVSLTCISGIVTLYCSNRRPPFNSVRMSGGVGSYGTIQWYNGRHWKGFCGTDGVVQDMEPYYQQLGYVNSNVLDVGPRCPSAEQRLQNCLANGTLQTCKIKTETVIYAQVNVSEEMKEGSVMLSDGNYTAGVLQVFYNNSWLDVCTTMTTAHVACRQLGFYSVLGVYDDLSAIGLSKGQRQSNGPMARYNCIGSERSLDNCSFNVDESACQLPASSIVACNFGNGKQDGQLRLSDGGNNYGRIEIAVNGYWGTVCSQNFDKAAADVACRELGFNESLKINRNFGGGQFLPVFVYGTYCIGDESRLADCSNISTSVPGCDYTNNVAITCNVNCPPLDISNGSTNCSLGDDGVPSYEDTCNVTCNNGFALNGSATRSCLGDGTWSGTDDECVKVYCPPLPDIVNGSISCILTPSNEDVCSISCDTGYRLSGSSTRTCLSNSSWSNMDGSCEAVSCQPQPTINNGRIDCSQGQDGISYYGDSCRITCNTGYELANGVIATRNCQSDGTWSGKNGGCVRVKCQALYINNGDVPCSKGDDGVLSYEDTCSVTCNTGYTLTGSDLRTCQSDGSWSGTDGSCKRVQCQAFSSFDNGKISCSLGSDGIHSYQDTCSVTCNAGYTLSGSDTRMCLSNGSWSGMDGRCERVKCQPLSKINDGNVTCSLGNDGVLSYEDTCSVTCNTGYTLTGSDTRMCQSDGSWSGTDGACGRVKCQSIAELNNGSITCSLGDDGVLSYEDMCNVTCITGYTLTGSDTRMCQSDGSWSGMDGACGRVTCQSITEVNNGNVTCSLRDDGVYSYEDTCSVTCAAGYTLTGSNITMCQRDGSWSSNSSCRKVDTGTVSPGALSQSDDDNNVGAVIGVVVGILCVLAVIIIIIVVIYFVKRWYDRNRIAHQKFKDEMDPDDNEKYSSVGPGVTMQSFDNPTYEMD